MTDQPTTQQPVVTLEIVKSKFNLALTALHYQEALQRFENWAITPENIADTQEKIKKVRGFMRTLAGIKDEGKAPALAECRMWDTAYNGFLTPLQNTLSTKEAQLQAIVNKVAEENRVKENERLRVEGIKKAIDTFILETSQQIAMATTSTQLVSIEKTIGSHKGNKSRYQEFLPELVERCNELTPLIKKQKEFIEELKELEKQHIAAMKAEDDRALLAIKEQQELVQHSIEEKKIQVQEAAIAQAIKPDDTPTVQSESTAIKYRRQQWKWEVKDIKTLAKKAPHLVILSANEEKIDELLKTKKADGSLKDVEELEVFGIRFYLEKKA